VGLEIDEGTGPRAVVFSRNGADRSAVTFQPTFSGRGYCLVLNLLPGTYSITGQGSTTIGADGALWFPCTGTTYSITAF
jgi:hypothetical protein